MISFVLFSRRGAHLQVEALAALVSEKMGGTAPDGDAGLQARCVVARPLWSPGRSQALSLTSLHEDTASAALSTPNGPACGLADWSDRLACARLVIT